jgi:diguanylate cyclase (GGDEF)-like protein/PAS domain S-box-containing protein
MAYERNLNIPEVLTLMEKASTANAEEKNRLRQELYSKMLPLYQFLLKSSFRQVHFHFADGISFLRMHKPKLFGDQLAAIRPSVILVNNTKKPDNGYEIGRSWQAYRFIFPLSTATHHLGSVEISLPMSTLLTDLMDNFPGEYRFIVSKEMAAKHLDSQELKNHFTVTSFSDAFLYETDDPEAIKNHDHPEDHYHISEEQQQRINKALHKDFTAHLQEFKTVSFPLSLADRSFLVQLLPIHDISGEPTGYLMTYEQSPTLKAMTHRYTVGYLLVTAFSLLLIFLHVLHTNQLFNKLLILQQLQQNLNDSHAELDQIFNNTADGLRLINLDRKILRVNATFTDLVRLPMDQVIGRQCYEVFSGPKCHTDNCPLILICNGAEHVENESEKSRQDGTSSTCMVTASPYYNAKGELTGIIEDFRDISERKRLEQRLQTLSTTDELTGLCNRRGFMSLARQQLDYVERAGGEIFIIFADLDNMKWINDNLGHEAGDKALIITARLLRTAVRDADIVGRMGGDEFAVLLTSASSSDSEPILLARLENELAEINKELPPEQQIAISFGITNNQTKAVSLEGLLAQADARMYAVKERRKTAALSKAKALEDSPSPRGKRA